MTLTKILSINDRQAIPTARQIIENGGIIAFPTDTVYGLASSPFNPTAIQKIYEAKDRPEEKALPVLIGDYDQLGILVLMVSERVERIIQTYWPGPLTLILPKSPNLPPDLSPYPTVGIRMPNLDFTLELLRATGPLATTSANRSGGPNPTTAQEVVDQLDGRIDLILDGGETPGPTASTVVDTTGPELVILREGPITLADLQSLFDEGRHAA